MLRNLTVVLMLIPMLLACQACNNSARASDWLYQLQNAIPSDVAKRAADIAIIDYSRDGADSGRYSSTESE